MLEFAALIGLISYWVVRLFRSTGTGKRLILTGRRPWACNLCSAVWPSAVMGAALWWATGAVVESSVATVAGSAIGLLLLDWSETWAPSGGPADLARPPG